MITEQEFFDKTARHLLAQGKRAENGCGCLYHTASGLKCAAGVHIPEELYDPLMEGDGIEGLLIQYPELQPYFPNKSLAYSVQAIHDNFLVDINDFLYYAKDHKGLMAWLDRAYIAAGD